MAAFLFTYMERVRQLFSFSSMEANCRTGFGYDLRVQIARKYLNMMSEMLKILRHNDKRVCCHYGLPSLQGEDRCMNIPTYGIPPHSTGLPPIGPLPKKALAIQLISR